MTTELSVAAGASQYPLIIGSNMVNSFPSRLAEAGVAEGTRLFLVTDDHVVRTGLPGAVKEVCESAGYPTSAAVVQSGDGSKSLATLEQLYESMLQTDMRRDGVVVAIGGGMVGDLAGFAAATYLRGVRFVQVPTTLLAHDSSIGGKVGVNLKGGKNLAGAFHHPLFVFYDMASLQSLPQREWTGGMAEVIKEAIIGDPALFAELEQQPVPVFPGEELAEHLVARAAAVKIQIVQADERERGERMKLNLGHTVGHAIEQCSGYELHHGECVGMGMAVEALLAEAMGLLEAGERQRIEHVLTAHGLEITPPDVDRERLTDAMNVDKKRSVTGWTLVLPAAIGDVRIVPGVEPNQVMDAWHQARSRS